MFSLDLATDSSLIIDASKRAKRAAAELTEARFDRVLEGVVQMYKGFMAEQPYQVEFVPAARHDA